MSETLTIAIAHNDLETLVSLHTAVVEIGHDVRIDATTGRQLIEEFEDALPDLIIAKEELPDMCGLTATRIASNDRPIPVIVLLDRRDSEPVRCFGSVKVLAILAEPVRRADLVPTIPLVMQRFRQFENARKHVYELTSRLKDGLRPINPAESGACPWDL